MCWAGKPVFRVPLSLKRLAQTSTGRKEKQSLFFEKLLGKSILGIFKKHNDITRSCAHLITTKTATDAEAQETGPPLSTSTNPSQRAPNTEGPLRRGERRNAQTRRSLCLCWSDPVAVRTLSMESRPLGKREDFPFPMTRNQRSALRHDCPYVSTAVYYTDISG